MEASLNCCSRGRQDKLFSDCPTVEEDEGGDSSFSSSYRETVRESVTEAASDGPEDLIAKQRHVMLKVPDDANTSVWQPMVSSSHGARTEPVLLHREAEHGATENTKPGGFSEQGASVEHLHPNLVHVEELRPQDSNSMRAIGQGQNLSLLLQEMRGQFGASGSTDQRHYQESTRRNVRPKDADGKVLDYEPRSSNVRQGQLYANDPVLEKNRREVTEFRKFQYGSRPSEISNQPHYNLRVKKASAKMWTNDVTENGQERSKVLHHLLPRKEKSSVERYEEHFRAQAQAMNTRFVD